MSDVKWIKIVTDIFDDEKILLIESMPEADAVIVIWFKLLTLAGKINNGGVLMFNDKLPYTDEMLATIFRRPVNIVRLAIKTFENFGMVEVINNTITIPNWSKHQTLDQLEERKEYMKNYMREYRNKQKLLAEGNKVPENGLPLKEWKKVIDYFDNECAYCGERDTELEQEHIIPVSKGGKYEMGNIIPACRSCNSSKQNKNIHEWYEQQEFYNGLKLNKIVNFCKLYNVNLRKANVNSLEEDIEEEVDIDNKIYSPVIEYLNSVCKTNYKISSKKTKSLIDARVNESFTLDDFKKVIDIKSKEWLNTDMAKYLRPETLFGTKFEGYLNQSGPVKPKPTNKFHNFIQSDMKEGDLEAMARKRFEKIIQDKQKEDK